MKPEDIRSLWIRYDEEDNTYSIDIETKDMCINFPRVNVQFLCGEYVAFPVRITTLDENKNMINEHAITFDVNQNTEYDQVDQIEKNISDGITEMQECINEEDSNGEGNSQ